MTLRDRIHDYYDALRNEEPLAPFFAVEPAPAKFGIQERLYGHEEITRALADQSRSTTDWRVDSTGLRVERRQGVGWFTDEVGFGWLDADAGERYDFDTRWSGTLVREEDTWHFVTMHVSVGYDFRAGRMDDAD